MAKVRIVDSKVVFFENVIWGIMFNIRGFSDVYIKGVFHGQDLAVNLKNGAITDINPKTSVTIINKVELSSE